MEQTLRTQRSFTYYFFLNLLTFDIYAIVQMYHISKEINIVAENDGKHTMNFLLILFIFSWLTFGIAPFVWWHRISNRIGDQLKQRNIDQEFSAEDFWIWNVIGSIIFIGPYVYMYKLLHAMNAINANYNNTQA